MEIAELVVNKIGDELGKNVNASEEPSRLIRVLHLKYKCFIAILSALVILAVLAYFAFKIYMQDVELGKIKLERMQKIVLNATEEQHNYLN